MKQEDSDGTVRIFSARACAAPLEKKEMSNTTLRSTRAIWPSAVLVLVFTISAYCYQPSQDTYYVGRRFPFNNRGSFLLPFHSLYFLTVTRI